MRNDKANLQYKITRLWSGNLVVVVVIVKIIYRKKNCVCICAYCMFMYAGTRVWVHIKGVYDVQTKGQPQFGVAQVPPILFLRQALSMA